MMTADQQAFAEYLRQTERTIEALPAGYWKEIPSNGYGINSERRTRLHLQSRPYDYPELLETWVGADPEKAQAAVLIREDIEVTHRRLEQHPWRKTLLQGEVDFSCAKVADVIKLINGENAELRVLGVFDEKRDPQLPDVPTLGELGYYNKWYGSARAIVAPKGTPENIIKFYEDAFKKTMEDKDVVEAHKKAGMILDYKDSKDLGRLIDEQLAFCKDVVSKLYEKK